MLLVVLLIAAIRTYSKRAAEHRAAHDARLRAMAQIQLATARKKKAADEAAAKAAPAPVLETPAIPPAREERDCPFCAEPILKKAKVCKHCGRDVDALA